MRLHHLLLLATAVPASACGPADDTGPATVRVLARDDGGAYGLRVARLETLTSARHVRGGAAVVRGGGSIVLEEVIFSDDLRNERRDDVQQSTLVGGDRAVLADYDDTGDVLLPRDWETLLMFSFYHAAERGLDYYRELGVEEEALVPFVTHFPLRLTTLATWGAPLVTDNAAYAPLADALLLFPQKGLADGVPLAANEGVIAHELSHGLKHRRLHGDDRVPVYAREGWPNVAVNSYRADDEGLADFFAAVFTGDPDYIAPSIPGAALDRDLRVERRFTSAMADKLRHSVAGYDPYVLGSAFASWLWATAGDSAPARRDLARAVALAVADLEGRLGPTYRITQLIDAIMVRAAPALKDRGCALLNQRLEGSFREVRACGIAP